MEKPKNIEEETQVVIYWTLQDKGIDRNAIWFTPI